MEPGQNPGQFALRYLDTNSLYANPASWQGEGGKET